MVHYSSQTQSFYNLNEQLDQITTASSHECSFSSFVLFADEFHSSLVSEEARGHTGQVVPRNHFGVVVGAVGVVIVVLVLVVCYWKQRSSGRGWSLLCFNES